MISKFEIRESQPGDITEIEHLYTNAFPDENLLPLVKELLGISQQIKSLVGIHDNSVVGHICFTFCHVEGNNDKVALLAPLAVTPSLHKQGVGSSLIEAGLYHLRDYKVGYVFVLGDPGYYKRFGFEPEHKVMTPYLLPKEWDGAWQSIQLCDSTVPYEGKLSVPAPWRHIELWTS